jgi:hypothetical protein
MNKAFGELMKLVAETDVPQQLEFDLHKSSSFLIDQFKQHHAANPGAAHVEVHYTSKGSGEEAVHKIHIGADLEDLYKQDVDHLHKLLPTLSGVHHQAATELLSSRAQSLFHGPGNNPAHTTKDAFEPVAPGLKRHLATGELHVHGVSVGKTVITPGVHKEVKSSEKTIAKNQISHSLPSGSGKYRQFAVGSAHNIKLV